MAAIPVADYGNHVQSRNGDTDMADSDKKKKKKKPYDRATVERRIASRKASY